MNVLFLTIGNFDNVAAGSVHIDLVKEIVRRGHKVYVACTNTSPGCESTIIEQQEGVTLLRIKTGSVKKNTNLIQKGISTIRLEQIFINAIKERLNNVRFDLVLYHTPPVTFEKVVKYIKLRDGASSYLLLKDIFPQNAVDLGMMHKSGLKGFVYGYFRKKEKNLYAVSDYIGCMSPANVGYLIKHNPDYPANRVEVAPNSVTLYNTEEVTLNEKREIREKYGLPLDKPIFVYGGNLGKPQDIDYLIRCLDANRQRQDCVFLIVGSGAEYPKLEKCFNAQDSHRDATSGSNMITNVRLMKSLPKKDYDILMRSCDVGLIFLDHRFTIPNYPSRMLSYLQSKMPILCATDSNTDMGRIAEENGYGYWCESVRPEDFTAMVDKMLQSNMRAMGQRGFDFLCQNYLTEHTYNAIFKHFER